jgi:transcriptional/translational regulatory protein YebC/TACO1
VAVLVEVLTDNRNRAGSEIRSLFTRGGGSLAEPGAVAWQFERKGVIVVPKSAEEDDVMMVGLDAGLEDLTDEGYGALTAASTDVPGLRRRAPRRRNILVESADVTMLPTAAVPLTCREGQSRPPPHRTSSTTTTTSRRLRQLRHP